MTSQAKTHRRGSDERRFQRVRPSGLMARTATLVIDARRPPITCNVIDYSLGGACLDLDLALVTALPKRFELLYGGNKKKCRLVWSKGRRLGVCF